MILYNYKHIGLFQLGGNVYVLLADEATDASHNKQLSICLRFVDDEHELKEYFL